MRKINHSIILFVIIYSVIFSCLFFLKSYESNSKLEIVSIGVISPSNNLASQYEFVSQLAQNKINEYCNQTEEKFRFNFINTNAEGNPQKAVELVENFYDDEVHFIVGLGWNSQLNSSYKYAIDNNMIIVSPSSTSPFFAKEDTCFRLLPDDQKEATALADSITKYGIDAVIVLQRDCPWATNFADIFYCEYRARGGEIVDFVSYKPDSQSINNSIERANKIVYDSINYKGKNKIGVLLFALEEASDVLIAAEKKSALMNVTWFCTETNTLDKCILNEAGHIASKVSLIGPFNTHIYNEDFQAINNQFEKKFGEPIDFCLANVYDGCWLLALSILEADSRDPVDAYIVFGDVAYNHYGITGPLDVNSNGDRSWIRYYFYGYYEINGKVVPLRAGGYTRLEKNDKMGSSISQSPYDVVYDNFPYYMWDKQFGSK